MSRRRKTPKGPNPQPAPTTSTAPNSLIPAWMSPYQASVAARMPPGTTLDLAQVGAPVQPGQITFTSGRVSRSAEVLIGTATGGTVTVRLLAR